MGTIPMNSSDHTFGYSSWFPTLNRKWRRQRDANKKMMWLIILRSFVSIPSLSWCYSIARQTCACVVVGHRYIYVSFVQKVCGSNQKRTETFLFSFSLSSQCPIAAKLLKALFVRHRKKNVRFPFPWPVAHFSFACHITIAASFLRTFSSLRIY